MGRFGTCKDLKSYNNTVHSSINQNVKLFLLFFENISLYILDINCLKRTI